MFGHVKFTVKINLLENMSGNFVEVQRQYSFVFQQIIIDLPDNTYPDEIIINTVFPVFFPET